MKNNFFISAICALLMISTPNFATAHHGFRSHHVYHGHHGHFHHGFHHHHHHHGYGRIGWAVPAAFIVGGIVGATIVSSQIPQYVAPPHQLPPSIYPNPYARNYPYPQPPRPYVDQSAPPDNGYWHYCPSSRHYYPYVRTCPEPWLEVVPR